jgi:hypothetical protein
MLRRLLWLIPLLLALAFAALYFALDAWLESAGGRHAIERTLSERAGRPVRLEGEFDVVLLPSPGVSGTRLVIGDPGGGPDLVESAGYQVALALRPLIREELVVQRLALEGIALAPRPGEAPALFIPGVTLWTFRENEPAPFRVDLGFAGTIEGQVEWQPAAGAANLELDWNGWWLGRLKARARLETTDAGLFFPQLWLQAEDMTVSGDGCYRDTASPALDLDLSADRIDLDRLAALMPEGEGGTPGLPFQLNLRLAADEVRRGEITAWGTVLEYGRAPDCMR